VFTLTLIDAVGLLLLLAAAAMLACYVPALRALKIDPIGRAEV